MLQSQQDIGGVLCVDFANGAELPEPVDNPAALREVARFRVLLHRLLSQGQNHRGVLPAVRGYGWGWIGPAEDVARSLWPVAWSAALLLTGPDLARLKCCDGCGRLFVDASRNRSRRWCDMQGCGNRAKVARHRQRVG